MKAHAAASPSGLTRLTHCAQSVLLLLRHLCAPHACCIAASLASRWAALTAGLVQYYWDSFNNDVVSFKVGLHPAHPFLCNAG